MKLLVLIPSESSSNKQHWSGSKGTQALSLDQSLLKIFGKINSPLVAYIISSINTIDSPKLSNYVL